LKEGLKICVIVDIVEYHWQQNKERGPAKNNNSCPITLIDLVKNGNLSVKKCPVTLIL